MTKLDKTVSVALIASLAATAGWGASSFTSRLNNSAATAAAPANNFQPSDQFASAEGAVTKPAIPAQVSNQLVAPARTALSAGATAASVEPVAETARATQRAATRPRVVNQRAYENSRGVASNETAYEPRVERKRGMSNTMKNVIAIGGGTAVGAAIGGIAGGRKGAAIGALIGGGGAGVYTWMKHKKHEPVF
ncbi:MAG TPA: hypothetical protein VFD58_14190 [Blastocatellia bacterium]|nr:hypothetical protein [Blastocatellia bacterium]